MDTDNAALQTIADRIAIGDLLTNYAKAVDTRDWDLFRSVFTADAHIDYTSAGGEKGDVEAIVKFLDASMGLFEMTQHLITNHDVAIDGDSATVTALFYNPMKFVDDGPQFFCGGAYHHKLVRTENGWQSQELIEKTAWTNGMPGA